MGAWGSALLSCVLLFGLLATGVIGPLEASGQGFTGGVFVATGDLDGTGRAEIIAGAGPGGVPRVRAYNADGTPRATDFLAYPAGFTGGVRVAACDFDGTAGRRS